MSPRRELTVWVNDHKVGTLIGDDDIWRFAYDSGWQAWDQGFDLSPALPRAKTEHLDGSTVRPVQWYFDNLLPEENLRSVLAKEVFLDESDAFGLLAHFGGESAGSLVLLRPGESPVGGELKALSLAALSARIQGLPMASLTKAAPKRMSLAGAQHKMVVTFNAQGLFEPTEGQPSTQILKPNSQSPHYPSTVINEYFCMRLAKAVKLDVPEVHLLYAPEPVYLIDRFDRSLVGAQVHRLHIVDACQLLNKARTFKYEQATISTLLTAVDACTRKAKARLQLYRWLLFNFFIGNGDNHLKNLSFHVDTAGANLASFYDLLSTAVYDTRAFVQDDARWPAVSLAIGLPNAQLFSDVNQDVLIATGKALGLAVATAERELKAMMRDLPLAADKLLAELVADQGGQLSRSPVPDDSLSVRGGEIRLLRAIRHVILQTTLKQAES